MMIKMHLKFNITGEIYIYSTCVCMYNVCMPVLEKQNLD